MIGSREGAVSPIHAWSQINLAIARAISDARTDSSTLKTDSFWLNLGYLSDALKQHIRGIILNDGIHMFLILPWLYC